MRQTTLKADYSKLEIGDLVIIQRRITKGLDGTGFQVDINLESYETDTRAYPPMFTFGRDGEESAVGRAHNYTRKILQKGKP